MSVPKRHWKQCNPPPVQPPPEGHELRKMKRSHPSEDAYEATERARSMSWFGRVTREHPYCVGWIWIWALRREP